MPSRPAWWGRFGLRRESGFDFSLVDPYLGSEARRYAIALDDFHKTKTIGLTR